MRDVGLPEMDGGQVLERLRDVSDVPVRVLTAHGQEAEKGRGLRGGVAPGTGVEVAGHEVAGTLFREEGVDLLADVHHIRAAGVEMTAGGRVDRARHVAGEDDPLALLLDHRIGNRHRRKQGLRVRVQWRVVELVAVGHLDDLAEVHHGHAVGDVAHHRQVVGDEEVGQAELLLEVFEQVHDLGLDRDVERGPRLVADDEVRIGGKRPGDADALPLAAGELVRVAVGEVGVEADRLQQFLHALGALVLGHQLVDLHRLGHDVAHGHAWVQRGVRILEDHLQVAPHLPHLGAVERGQVAAVEDDVAFGRLVELQDGASRGRFTAPRFADEAQRLAALDGEGNAVDRLHGADLALEDDPLREREVHLEVLHIQQRLTISRGGGGVCAGLLGDGSHASFLQRFQVTGRSFGLPKCPCPGHPG